ncbi:hypothetical protein [Shewanella sp. M16]|nr:hypothetical protein [Shewanella sp. M16]
MAAQAVVVLIAVAVEQLVEVALSVVVAASAVSPSVAALLMTILY